MTGKSYLSERSADLKMDIHLEQVRLTQSIDSLRQDVLFLASLPSVSGHSAGQREQWDRSPRQDQPMPNGKCACKRFLPPFCAHIRNIIRRVISARQARGGSWCGWKAATVMSRWHTHDALQARGDRDYFKAGLMLTAGRVYLSEFCSRSGTGRNSRTASPCFTCRHDSVRCERSRIRHGGDQQGCALVVCVRLGGAAVCSAELYRPISTGTICFIRMPRSS